MQARTDQIDQVKSVLLQQRSLQDCAVLTQMTETGQLELIAYIVSSEPILPQKLQSSVEGVLRETRLPINFIPVSSLPLTASGEVDEEALRTIPVLDETLVQEIEEQLKSRPEIDRVAVVLQESGEKQPPLHLSDLLPNWQQQQTLTPTETITEDIPPEIEERELLSQAIADGGLLPSDPDTSTTLPQVLQKAADKIVGKSIIYLQRDGTEIVQSYAELLEEAHKILAGLRKLGLNPQDKVILQLENNGDIIPAFWGCILGGLIPTIMEVPPTYTESNPVASKLRQIWQFLDSPLIITNEGLQDEILFLLPESEQKVSSLETLRQNLPDKFDDPTQPDETAFLNLTSGSTGLPKCVKLTHRNLISRARGANSLNHHKPEEIILNWLPFDHIGSISDWHIRCVELGCQQIYAPKEYILGRALNWLDLIDQYRVTHSWAPNFAYALMNDLLDREPHQTWDLSCVQFLLTAGEAVSSQAVEEFRKKMAAYGLKKTAIRPAFGMAELGSGITYYQPTAETPLTFHRVDKSSLTGTIKRVGAEHPNNNIFADLGSVIPGVTIRIVDTESSVLPEDTIGRLQVSGDAVSPGYFNNPEANQTSFLENGWFETGDLGFIRNGHLVVTGRAKETIIINGANYYSHEIEAVVEEIKGLEVSYTAACAVRDGDGATEKLAIFFHPTTQNDSELLLLLPKIRQQAIAKIGINPDYLIPVTRETIPKTAIGKIQRLQLSQRFETGEFNSILKQLDILLGNQNTIPDWFYRKIWRPKQLSRKSEQNTQGVTLVFLDSLGLGSYLCQTLPENCIAVEMGEEYIQKEKVYCINPTKPEHYRQLVQSVGVITQILHLWTYDEERVEIPHPEALQQTQERGIYSLLFLVQALAVQKSNQDVRLLWISSKSQATSATEEIAPAKSTVLGLIKSIPQELPGLSTCHVDLLPDAVETNGQYILQELKALSPDLEVAYRDGQRLVCRLEKVDWHKQQQQQLPFKPGGIYLLSGGLGGIGCEIAQYLLQNYQAKLLLLGRSPFSEKRSVYQKLEQLDGEIIYEAVDIGNLEQLQPVVTKALSEWRGELDGVIHLAGVYRDSLILDSSVEQIAEVFRPKVLGTWVLHQLLKDKPDSIFIHFSSLASFFGGMAIAAYSAANCFLESFAHYQRREGKLASYCLAWSSWQDIGISQGNKMQDVLRTKGYFAIGLEQGLFSLLVGLHYNPGQLLVGLEGCNRNIRPYIETKANQLQKLTAYFTSTEGNQSSVLPEFKMCDRFGRETQCQFEQLLLMPLTEEGEIDRLQLLQNSNSSATREKIAPRTELERQLALIWQEVLEISTIGICDHFFELGGNSIKAMILVNKLQEELSEILHPVALFDAPTIAKFADYLQENYPESVEETQHQASVENMATQQIDPMRQYLLNPLNHSPSNTLPLTIGQEYMWLRPDPAGIYNNTWRIWRIEGTLNLKALQDAIAEIARRHTPLHTTFAEVKGSVVQVVRTEMEPAFEIIDLPDLAENEDSQILWNYFEQFALRQFDLVNGPIVQVNILRLSQTCHILMPCINHIAIDAWSWGIFINELNPLYSAFVSGQPSPLPKLPMTFPDFTRWYHQWLREGVLEESLNYWRPNLAGAQLLELPCDRPLPANPTFREEAETLNISPDLRNSLENISKQVGVALYVTLLSAYGVVLASVAHQEDFVIDANFASRPRIEAQSVISNSVNILPMRLNLIGDPTFAELLHRVQPTFRNAYAHHNLPFPQLVDIWQAEGKEFKYPLSAVFNLVNVTNSEQLELPGMKVSFIRMDNRALVFKLNLRMLAIDGGYIARFSYMTDVFDATTVARIARKFHLILESVVTDCQKPLSDLFVMLNNQNYES